AYMYAIYFDYKVSAADIEYNFAVGSRVTSAGNLPSEMSAVSIPAGRYAVFTTGRGPGEKVLPQAWMEIWRMSASELGGESDLSGSSNWILRRSTLKPLAARPSARSPAVTEPNRWSFSPTLRVNSSATLSNCLASTSASDFSFADLRTAEAFICSITVLLAA